MRQQLPKLSLKYGLLAIAWKKFTDNREALKSSSYTTEVLKTSQT